MTNPKSRQGLTLVELVVAVALSALLMAALTGVLRGVVNQSRALDGMQTEAWPVRFVDCLHRDLMTTESIWMTDQTIYLSGEFSADVSGQAIQQVGYRCMEVSTTSVAGLPSTALVRTHNNRRGLLALGPRRVLMERIDTAGEPQPLPPVPGPVPDRLRVWVWDTLDAPPILVRDLVLR